MDRSTRVTSSSFRREVLARADRDDDGLLREQCDAMLRKVLAESAGGPAFGSLREAVRPPRPR